MQEAKNMKMYRQECHESLGNDYLRTALDKFAIAYKDSRSKAFADFDVEQLIDDIAHMKDDVLLNLEELYEQFKKKAEEGVKIYMYCCLIASDFCCISRLAYSWDLISV